MNGSMLLDGVQRAIEIRGRGNSTWTWPKKPYKIDEAVFGVASSRIRERAGVIEVPVRILAELKLRILDDGKAEGPRRSCSNSTGRPRAFRSAIPPP